MFMNQVLNWRHRSPLHLACRNGNIEAAVCLLEHGADPLGRDSNGMQASVGGVEHARGLGSGDS